MAMMKYSKGGETTNVHVLYWNDCLFWGMYRVRGLALMAKSIQALCEGERRSENLDPLEPLHTPSPSHTQSPDDRRPSPGSPPHPMLASGPHAEGRPKGPDHIAHQGAAWKWRGRESYLILLQAALRHDFVPLLLEGDDDQGHKDVYKEEGEDHEVDHIENGQLHAVPRAWALLLVGGIHRVFQHPGPRANTKHQGSPGGHGPRKDETRVTGGLLWLIWGGAMHGQACSPGEPCLPAAGCPSQRACTQGCWGPPGGGLGCLRSYPYKEKRERPSSPVQPSSLPSHTRSPTHTLLHLFSGSPVFSRVSWQSITPTF